MISRFGKSRSNVDLRDHATFLQDAGTKQASGKRLRENKLGDFTFLETDYQNSPKPL